MPFLNLFFADRATQAALNYISSVDVFKLWLRPSFRAFRAYTYTWFDAMFYGTRFKEQA